MKELERVNSELDSAKKASTEMENMHRDNIKATMNAIRNFFLWVLLFTIFSILLYPLKHYFNSQGADQEQNVTDLAKLESVFQQHPELHHQLAPVINCAATRVERAESNLKVQQQEQERSAEERELFQRLVLVFDFWLFIFCCSPNYFFLHKGWGV